MTVERGNILTLNIGSSSIKYAVFSRGTLTEITKGKIQCDASESEAALGSLLQTLSPFSPSCCIAHRIVHGGDVYKRATLLNDKDLDQLEKYSPFAPLHQPHNLNGVRICQRLLPDTPQYGCFDTGFHAGHDELHSTFPIPESLRKQGLKRYGFHGLSYEWIARQLQSWPSGIPARVVVAHLGSGASLCAMSDGKSVDSTMGLTALDGLPMATRTGSIDAGLILYLSRNPGYSVDRIEHLLYSESGLMGLSGISNDVKTLEASSDPRAKFALEYFCFKTAQHIAMMAVSLGGLDHLVFTGGIGENSTMIREAILNRLKFLPDFAVEVIPTNEEKMMAIQISEVLNNA